MLSSEPSEPYALSTSVVNTNPLWKFFTMKRQSTVKFCLHLEESWYEVCLQKAEIKVYDHEPSHVHRRLITFDQSYLATLNDILKRGSSTTSH